MLSSGVRPSRSHTPASDGEEVTVIEPASASASFASRLFSSASFCALASRAFCPAVASCWLR